MPLSHVLIWCLGRSTHNPDLRFLMMSKNGLRCGMNGSAKIGAMVLWELYALAEM